MLDSPKRAQINLGIPSRLEYDALNKLQMKLSKERGSILSRRATIYMAVYIALSDDAEQAKKNLLGRDFIKAAEGIVNSYSDEAVL